MDFNLNPRNESYRKRIRDFVDQELLPLEPVSYTHLTLPTNREV